MYGCHISKALHPIGSTRTKNSMPSLFSAKLELFELLLLSEAVSEYAQPAQAVDLLYYDPTSFGRPWLYGKQQEHTRITVSLQWSQATQKMPVNELVMFSLKMQDWDSKGLVRDCYLPTIISTRTLPVPICLCLGKNSLNFVPAPDEKWQEGCALAVPGNTTWQRTHSTNGWLKILHFPIVGNLFTIKEVSINHWSV